MPGFAVQRHTTWRSILIGFVFAQHKIAGTSGIEQTSGKPVETVGPKGMHCNGTSCVPFIYQSMIIPQAIEVRMERKETLDSRAMLVHWVTKAQPVILDTKEKKACLDNRENE